MDGGIAWNRASRSSRLPSTISTAPSRFYEAMGLTRSQAITDGVAFFQMGGAILALWPRAELREGCRRRRFGSGAVRRVYLAYNTRSDAEVDEVLAAAEKAGGRIVKPAQRPSGAAGTAISPTPRAISGKSPTIRPSRSTPTAAISLPRMNHDRYDDCLHLRHPELGEDHRHGRRLGQRRAAELLRAEIPARQGLRRSSRSIPARPARRSSAAWSMRRLADIPEPIDMVDIFRASSAVPGDRRRGAGARAAAESDLDAARRPQRRGGRQGRGRRPQGRHEPLPEDRIWQAVGRDRLDRRQFAACCRRGSR